MLYYWYIKIYVYIKSEYIFINIYSFFKLIYTILTYIIKTMYNYILTIKFPGPNTL